MIILDANLLLYAVNKDAMQHAKAKVWLESILSGSEVVGFPWNVILAVLRLTTRPGVFRHPLRIERAFDLVAEWLNQPAAQVVHPGTRHLAILRGLLTPIGTGGNLDQIFFQLGRHSGEAFLARHPNWQARSVRVRRL